jgi:WhiB family transcriptional regulator, redox-sensing transcriptional regulator
VNRASLGWQARAACRDVDPAAFFPDAAPGTDAYAEQATEARMTCAGCPVRLPCRDYAVSARETWGVWGGTSPAERGTGRESLKRGAA